MENELKEEIIRETMNVLTNVDISFEIVYEPSTSDGANSCFIVIIELDTACENYFDDVEIALNNSGICGKYGLSYHWEGKDLCLCTNGWDN